MLWRNSQGCGTCQSISLAQTNCKHGTNHVLESYRQFQLSHSASASRNWSHQKKRSQATRVASEFDPCPEFLKASDPQPIEQLRCSLLSLNKPCVFLHILVPDIGKIAHDQSYAQSPCVGMSQTASVPIILPSSDIVTERTLSLEKVDEGKRIFGVSAQRRWEIVENTRDQYSAKEWYHVRAKHITSSICGQILTQKRKTVALLRLCFYPKPLLEPLPPPIAWGRTHEATARKKYRVDGE